MKVNKGYLVKLANAEAELKKKNCKHNYQEWNIEDKKKMLLAQELKYLNTLKNPKDVEDYIKEREREIFLESI